MKNNHYIKAAIENLIFVAEKPLTVERVSEIFPELGREEIKQILRELMMEYDHMERGFKIVEVAGGYQFRTRPEYARYISLFKRQEKTFRLSRAALETLAIIAYRQPITRTEIEEIRGVDSSGVITGLLERRLVRIRSRKDVPGRPFLYVTTEEFLEVFGLKTLADLPTLKELKEMEEFGKDV